MINQFTTLTSTAIPLKIENVDTDQIIPARFLKATTREGFGKQLFFDWRYDAQGNPKTDFPRLYRRNFNCREKFRLWFQP